ncbi:MFS transporter [Pseudokineococcus sp. 5B2Z-1]|uniref:MFS transporter n=1 Tax=Pseudokineococcus sp. 5B2Z-1 TaxID=3132744 RepID=UPI0030A56261
MTSTRPQPPQAHPEPGDAGDGRDESRPPQPGRAPGGREGEGEGDGRGQQQGQQQGYAHGQDPRRWKALAVCLVSGFMTLLDVSIINVALPSISQDLGASGSDLQWVLSGYALAFGLVLVPAGRLGDAHGRRRVFVAGLATFTLASLACGLAPSPGWLLAFRLLQGVGGGLLQPQVAAFIQSLFAGPERGRAFGLLGTSIGLSTAVGPLLGGTILSVDPDPSSWRLVFFVNIPIGLAGVVLAMRWLPASRPADDGGRRPKVDLVGVALLALTLTALLLPLLEQPPAPAWVALWLASAALAVAFVRWEQRQGRTGRDAVVDLSLFRASRYRNGVLVGLVYFTGFTTIFFVLSIYLQDGLGMSPLAAGLTQTPFAVGGAITPVIAGKAVERLGRRLVVGGLTAVAVGLLGVLAVVATLSSFLEPWQLGLVLVVPLLVGGAGSGVVISPNTTLTLSVVDPGSSGSASGVLQTSQRIGSSVGIALVGAVYFGVVAASGGSTGGGVPGGGGGGAGDASAYGAGLSASLAVAVVLVLLALVPAVADLRAERREQRADEGDGASA